LNLPLAQPKTPVTSRLRKEAQAKAGAAERVTTSDNLEKVVFNKESEETEKRIKKKRRSLEEEEEEKNEASRKMAASQVERRERNHRGSEEARVMMEVSDEEEDSVKLPPREEPRRSRAGWMKAWTATFDGHPTCLSLFAMATLLPPCRGVIVEGHPRNRDILIVGDIGRDDLYCVAGHLLLLTQNGRRSLTTFNTKEEYRRRMEQEDTPSRRALILFIDPEEFMEGIREATRALPDARDPAWQALWKEMRSGLAPHFKPIVSPHSRGLLDATDTSSGTRREDGGDDEVGDIHGGGTYAGIAGSAIPGNGGKGDGETGKIKRLRLRNKLYRKQRNYFRRTGGLREGSSPRPPFTTGIAADDGRERARPEEFRRLPRNPPHGLPVTRSYATARTLYKPPHERRTLGGWAAAEEGEIQPWSHALGGRGTNEQDYTHTRATRAYFSQSLTNVETREGPVMDIVGRGDKGSQSARMSQFLETYGGSLTRREVEWSNASPDLQWASLVPCLAESHTGP
jgi:hypothetical protein